MIMISKFSRIEKIVNQLRQSRMARILSVALFDAGGMVAVEFALLIPVMLTMYFGTLV